MKKYVALARVSSREQEREGFSLDVQEEALNRYAQRQGGQIVQLYRIAETASKHAERKTFKEMLAYAKKHAPELAGLLFYKVDRAARNIFDYVELERLELDQGVPVIYVAQPTENTPAGRMQRRILSNMASFYTEQQSLDVREGLARRVQSGLFVSKAPYGYKNVRIDGRSIIQVHPEEAENVRRIFELYAYHNHTLDSLGKVLADEGRAYLESQSQFTRSKLYSILLDRAYIGQVEHRGQWYPGSHEPLIDRSTFERVGVLLGGRTYKGHQSVYGADMLSCGHCGRPVVVEVKTKPSSTGPREYRYYRCARYTAQGHPSIRVNESDLDNQVLAMFAKMKIEDGKVRDWVLSVLRARTREVQQASKQQQAELQRQLSIIKDHKDRLLNLRLLEEIDAGTFSEKQAEFRERESQLALQVEAAGRQQSEHADLAVKVFELSQCLTEKWITADISEKRQLLEIVCLNFKLDGVNLVPQMRKPFDVLIEGLLVSPTRGERI